MLVRKQSGTTVFTAASATATPLSYDATRSWLKITVRGGSTSPIEDMVRAEKTNSTTLTFYTQGVAAQITVEWELFEFDAAVTVQDISITAEGTQAISAVDLDQSFMTITGIGGNSGWGGKYAPLLQFNSTTEIELDTDAVAWATAAEIQVIEYQGAAVQTVTHSLTTSVLTTTTAALSSVDEDATLLIGTMKIDANPIFFDGGFWRATLTSDVLITLNRGAGTSLTMTWNIFAVEFTDGVAVQSGEQSVVAPNTFGDISITAVADVDEAGVLFATMNQIYGMGCGQTSQLGDGGVNAMFGVAFTDTSTVRATRDGVTFDNTWTWQVFDFASQVPVLGMHAMPLTGAG